jgi:hypothetical protein
MTRVHTSGSDKPWQFRPSDHLRGGSHRRWKDGPVRSMEEPGFFARLFGRG